MSDVRSKRGSGLFAGIILILLGSWFLLDRLGVALPGLGDLWPLFPLVGGLALVASYVLGHDTDSGVLVPGVGGFLIGVFFLLITVGPLGWSDLDRLWPVFPLIGGMTFGVVWAASRPRDSGLLVPAIGGLAVGIVGLLFTYDVVSQPTFSKIWPVAIIVVGLWLILSNVRRR